MVSLHLSKIIGGSYFYFYAVEDIVLGRCHIL